MSRTFDPKQQAVLDCAEEKQLVSAGAGSGKTTVMIKKIADLLLEEKVKPNEIVVLTFTVLASHEMKQRLIKIMGDELQKSQDPAQTEKISRILAELETASIDTIDGFCSKMCKKYFYALNLSPETSIATGLSLDYYVENSLKDTIKQALATDREEVIALADCFEKNARNLDALKQNLLNAFNFIMAQKDYEKFLDLSENEYLGQKKSADFLNNYLLTKTKKHAFAIEQLLPDIASAQNLYNALSSYLEVIKTLSDKNDLVTNQKQFALLPVVRFSKVADGIKDDVATIKAHFQEIKNVVEDFEFLSYISKSDLDNGNPHFTTFVKLLKLFITNYQATKEKYKVVDFLDLERKFLSLLLNPEIKNELFLQYKYIFVDEYQDINPMQDEIIMQLKSGDAKIFFVGDVKQSIYGFRQSTPELFLAKYKDYKTSKNSQSFDMNINFRSNPVILQFNNEIFSLLMTEEATDIDYKNDAQFDPKRTDFPQSATDVEIALFDEEQNEEELATGIYSVCSDNNTQDMQDSEINFVVDKINNLIGQEFFDSSIGQNRAMEYRDIAILARSINDSKSKKLLEALKLHHIPINISNKIEIKNCESVRLIYNILKVVNNNYDDVALLTYLVSNLGQMTLDEVFLATENLEGNLAEKLLAYQEQNNNQLSSKIKYAFDLIEEIKFAFLTSNNLEKINILLNTYHLKQYILNSENGENELDTLNNFLASLSGKEADKSLTEFVQFLKDNMDSDTLANLNDGVNAVTIQTIHASKGLEYPVVILFNSSKTFKPNNYRDDINFDSELGIGMCYYDLEARKKSDSIPHFAITTKNKIKCYKEELRLLYVATTRPKNKLIISGEAKFSNLKEKKIAKNNFLNLIYSVYMDRLDVDDESTEFKNCTIYHFPSFVVDKTTHNSQQEKSININGKNIDFVYPHSQLQAISLKNNVTAISHEQNIEYNILPNKLNVKENLNATAPSSAEIGTLYHKALSEIDFLSSYKATKTVVPDENLLKLAHQKIFELTRGATQIHHEAQFMMYLPYNQIYTDSEIENKVLVQGVVDLMIEFDDRIILVDFKYSKSNIDVLTEKYATQLKLYKLAIEKAKHKKVTESYIYQINTGDFK